MKIRIEKNIFRKMWLSRVFALAMLAVIMLVSAVPDAGAQTAGNIVAPRGTCTTDEQFDIPEPPPGQGILSTIIGKYGDSGGAQGSGIRGILQKVAEQMSWKILYDNGFADTMRALLTLYIAIYGILFTFGMVQVTLYDFCIRMLKVGLVWWLAGGSYSESVGNTIFFWLNTTGGWGIFIRFFNLGTDSIIAQVTSIAVGDPSLGVMGDPFIVLDAAVAKAVSAKMAVTLMAILFTGPYGLLFALLLIMSLGSFLRALFTAVWVYVMGLTVRALLLGLSPIFLACILFNRTRHIFDGWLNQIINSCLQPIFLFTFFAFFAKLIEASIDHILHVPVCWTEAGENLRGTSFFMHYWRYTVLNPSSGMYELYPGEWNLNGASGSAGGQVFPLDIISVLVFLTLSELASRFNSVAIMIASEISSASTNLSAMQGGLSNWFSQGKGEKPTPTSYGIGNRPVPGAPGTVGGAAGGSRGGGLAGMLGGIGKAMSGGSPQEGVLSQSDMASSARNKPLG